MTVNNRKISALLLLFVISINILAGCSAPSLHHENQEFAGTFIFYDIPGITAEEIEAIESFIAANVTFRCATIPGTNCFYTEDGTLQGFSPLVFEWLSDVFQIQFEPVVVQWNFLLEGLESRDYDFSVDIPTKWRNDPNYYVTDAIVEHGMRLYIAPTVSSAEIKSANRPLRYGYLDMWESEERLSAYISSPTTLIAVPNLATAQAMLLSGELDAFIGADTFETIITKYSAIDVIPGLSYNTVSLATCNPQLAPVISAAQKCLLAGGGYHLNQLQKDGYYQYKREKLIQSLTPQEKEYLEAHHTSATAIPVAASFDNYPYSFYNEQEADWQGIAIDLLEEIEIISGLKFEYVNSTNTAWPSLLAMLTNGEAAMTTELIRTPDRNEHYLWADTPYYTDYYALLSMTEYPDINVSQIANCKVGIITDTAYAETFMEMYPNHTNLIYYNTKLEAFDALSRGDVDLLMMTRNLLLSANNYLERAGYKTNLLLNRPYESLFGFNLEEQLLCSVVSKTQQLIEVDRIGESWTRRVFDYRSKMARNRMPYLITATVLLLAVLVLVSLLYVKTHKKGKILESNVKEKTLELHRQTEISYKDKLTGIYNRTKLDEDLSSWCENNFDFCLLMIDIDHFKIVNDTYGHFAGDQVLVDLASIISQNIRTDDIFARWGGEEFVVLQRGDIQSGCGLGNRLRHKIEVADFETVGHITVSIGVTSYSSGEAPAILFMRADEALYQSKESGRNAVTSL